VLARVSSVVASRVSSVPGLLAAALACAAACAPEGHETEVVRGSAADHGRALFSDPRASSSPSNTFGCATCHPPPADGSAARAFPGSSLAGATKRTSFWGGARVDLLESINDCRLLFMDAPTPWTSEDDDAQAMYAYLTELRGAVGSGPVPFTLVGTPTDLPPGDRASGEAAYGRTCAPCHGSALVGAGRLVPFAPKLPDEVDAAHASLSLADRRMVYLRKARLGVLVQTGGAMPPLSREALSDADLSAILAYLGQY
jgi:thiosulfate dehydrogenase